MAISPLTDVVLPAYPGNYSPNQGLAKSFFVVHHMAGTASPEACAGIFQTPGRGGSTHYGIKDGRIANYVDEECVAWANSDWDANCRSITCELSNETAGGDWPISEATQATAARLIAEIHRRRGWGVPSRATVRYHAEFAPTGCCGPYLIARFDAFVALCQASYHGDQKQGWVQEGGLSRYYEQGKRVVSAFRNHPNGAAWLDANGDYKDITGWVSDSQRVYMVIHGYRAMAAGNWQGYDYDSNGRIDFGGHNMTRYAGDNRAITARLAAEDGLESGALSPLKVILTTSASSAEYTAALNASAGKYPILYVNNSPTSNGGERELVARYKDQIDEIVVIGGVAAVSEAVAKSFTDIVR